MNTPLLALLVLMAAGPAAAADSGDRVLQKARIEQAATYVTTAALCERLGYQVQSDKVEEASAAVEREALAAGLSTSEAATSMSEAVDRQLRILQSAFQKSLETMDASGRFRPAVSAVLDRYAPRCADAARDPVFSKVIQAPPAAEIPRLRRDAIDSYVESAGEASWQTPTMRARADLLYAAGNCQAHLNPNQLASYTRGFVGAPAPADPTSARAQRWYEQQFQQGIEAAADTDLDAAQCAKVLAARRAKLTPKK